MGVIQRQGLKSSIVGFIGVGIGALSTLFVYPHALEVYGLFRTLFDAAVLVGIFVMMGSSVSSIRFFPKYQDDATGHSGLLTWLLMVNGGGFLLFLLLYPFIDEMMARFFFDSEDSAYQSYLIYLIPLTFFLALFNLLARYISNFKRITVPTIFEQLTIKVTLPLIILMHLWGWIPVSTVLLGVVASFAFASFGLLYYLHYLGELRLTKPLILRDKAGLKDFSNYSWYGLLSGLGSQVAFRIDSLMVSGYIDVRATGIYTISWAISEIIIKPMRSLGNIAGPILADHIEKNRLTEVKEIYRKSALNMTVIGCVMFFGMWTVLPQLFQLMPKSDEMVKGMYVVFFLGLAQVWDMMTGVNSEIIYYSKYYRFNLYLTLFLAILNIITNYIFIPMYGITGAALATCISMFIFNLVKLAFIKWRFGFFPFTVRMIPAFGFAVLSWLIASWIPLTGMALTDMIVKGGVFTILCVLAIYYSALAPDINHWIELVIRRLLFFRKKPAA